MRQGITTWCASCNKTHLSLKTLRACQRRRREHYRKQGALRRACAKFMKLYLPAEFAVLRRNVGLGKTGRPA